MNGVEQWVRDNQGNVVFTLGVSILAAGYSWWLYHRQKSPKTLDYSMPVWEALFSKAKDKANQLGGGLYVVYEPEDVDANLVTLVSPRLVKLHFENTGRKEIVDEDFEKPITIELEEGTIVELRVTAVSHDGVIDLGIGKTVREDGRFTLLPRLMNPGDWFEVHLVTDEDGGKRPKVSSWIRGQSRDMWRRQDIPKPPVRQRDWFRSLLLAPVFAAVMVAADWFINLLH